MRASIAVIIIIVFGNQLLLVQARVKNSTSLSANELLLENLKSSTFLVKTSIVILMFLRPAGVFPLGGTAATST